MKIPLSYLYSSVSREEKKKTNIHFFCLVIFFLLCTQSANEQFLNKWPEKQLGKFMARTSIDPLSTQKEEDRKK